MSKKRRGGHNKTLCCPICGMMMKYAKSKADQHRPNAEKTGPDLDTFGNPLLVTRRFYVCMKCETVAWFDYRQDGERGQLSKELEYYRKAGIKPPGLVGGFDELVG